MKKPKRQRIRQSDQAAKQAVNADCLSLEEAWSEAYVLLLLPFLNSFNSGSICRSQHYGSLLVFLLVLLGRDAMLSLDE